MAYLQLKGLAKRFGPVTAVNDASLDIASGEFVTLLGASGCGKTTLLRMIAGFTAPDGGEVWLNDRRIDPLPPRLRGMGFVFQSYALFPTMTVADNIGFGLRLRRRPRQEITERVAELCALTHLEGMESRYPHELSGGQQQRVALARALALNPSVLLLDEPLSALDAKIRALLRAEIRSLVERLRITTVYVTHDQEEALSMSDRVVVMDRGRFLQVGTPLEIYTRPATSLVADFIGTSNTLEAKAAPGGRIVVEDTPLEIQIPDHLRGLDPLRVCIRPEHIWLGRPGTGPGPAFTGTLASYAFLGQTVRSTIITPGGASLLVDLSTQEWLALKLAVGEAVAWRIQPGQAMIFADDSTALGHC